MELCLIGGDFRGSRLAEIKITSLLFTGAQPKAGIGHKMQTVRFFNVTLLGIHR